MSPTAAARELGLRSKRLAGRLGARQSSAQPTTRLACRPPDGPGARSARRVPAATLRGHDHAHRTRPVDKHSGCDAARIWEGYADRIVVERVEGDHLTMMQEDGGPARLRA